MKLHIMFDKNVPIPPRKKFFKKYHLEDMQIGDSFLAENVKINSMNQVIARAKAKTGFKFTFRKDGTGVRIWRI